MMKPTKLFRKIALLAHQWHDRAYTFWKVEGSGVNFRQSLTAQERSYFLQVWPVLQGNDLIAYDIGASVGSFSGFLSKMPNIKMVHAFEPIPSVYRQLSENMRNHSRVICHQVALGESEEHRTMHVLTNMRASSSLLDMERLHKNEFIGNYSNYKEEVKVVRLDNYRLKQSLPQPDFIKIDVQGYEDKVIIGGMNTIQGARYCLLEVSMLPLYKDSPVFDDIYQMMLGSGFRLTGIVDVIRGKSGVCLQVDAFFEKTNEKIINQNIDN